MKRVEPIDSYAYKILRKKNYFIKEFYDKLISKYNREDVCKLIKEFINLELLNDRYLSEMKICYFIHIKSYGKNYIYDYFDKKNISHNLIKCFLTKYNEDVFLNNIDNIIDSLKNKSKSDEYIYMYLLRKGYEEDEIKKLISFSL